MPGTAVPAAAVTAEYLDGRTAAGRPVRVRLGKDGLDMLAPDDGALVAGWPYTAARRVGEPREGELRLARAGTDERLTVRDPLLRREIQVRCPELRRRVRPLRILGPVTAVAAVGALAAAVVVWLPPMLARSLPAWADAGLGAAVLRQVEGGGECVAEPGRRALERLATPLLAAARDGGAALDPPPRVLVVDVADPNGLALPGNLVVLTRGLLTSAASSGEVAGVLAHELGHIAEAHPQQGAVRALGALGLASVLTLGADETFKIAFDTGAVLTVLAHSRSAEREADDWSLRIMTRAGVAPDDLAGFLRRMTRGERRGGTARDAFGLLSTHPAPEERLDRLAEAPAPPTPVRLLDQAGWRDLKAICEKKAPKAGQKPAG